MDYRLLNSLYEHIESDIDTQVKRYHTLHLKLIDEEEYQSPRVDLFIPEWENFYRKIYDFAIGKMKEHGMGESHCESHILRVLKNIWIYSEKHNSKVIKYAYTIGLLHDVADGKYIKPDMLPSLTEEVTNLLTELGFTPAETFLINYCYSKVSWSKSVKRKFRHLLESAEFLIEVDQQESEVEKEILELVPYFREAVDIVHDADWTDAQILRRCLDYNREKNPEIGDTELIEGLVKHWDEKLSILHKRASTRAARALMEKKYNDNLVLINAIKEVKKLETQN